MRKTCLLAALAVALSPLNGAAQEYVVKLKRPGLGDKTKAQVVDDFRLEFKILDNNGNVAQEADETKAHKFAYREAGLERAATGDELVKLKRHYEHAERTIKGTRETLPYQGKTVLIEKKGGRFEFHIEGGEMLEGKDAEELNEEFNKGDFRKMFTEHFLPRRAVKLNETWKFDVAALAKGFAGDGKIEIDETKSTGTGKLIKAYTKNGHQYGVVELTIVFPVTHFIDKDKRTAVKEGKITLTLQADGCIDGAVDDSRLKAALNGMIRAEINANGTEVTMVIGLRANFNEQRTLAK